MSHGPEHHMEHAEHAIHAVHDAFNRNVTMSIAIVAAVLACVTMLGHRSHNETLRLQGEALKLQGEALDLQSKSGFEKTTAGVKWTYYDTKNLTNFLSKMSLNLLKVLATNENSKEELPKIRALYQANVDKYDNKLEQTREEAAGFDKNANQYKEESREKMKEAGQTVEKSHDEHLKAERLDYGELGLQFGVVLCSLAILTRSRGFWYCGLVSSIIGTAVALTGPFALFMNGHH